MVARFPGMPRRCAVALALLHGALVAAPVAAPAAEGAPVSVTVMSRNLYLGAASA